VGALPETVAHGVTDGSSTTSARRVAEALGRVLADRQQGRAMGLAGRRAGRASSPARAVAIVDGGLPHAGVRILHLVSCRGWSSDAYLAARLSAELQRRGHQVWLGCRRGTGARVIDRARAEGVEQIEVFAFSGGAAPGSDAADVRAARVAAPRRRHHVHRGKEHWLAAVANRLSGSPRPLVRTRHIVQAVRPHAANRWLYQHATARVPTVKEIRQQSSRADW
jgi:hypothetical protein